MPKRKGQGLSRKTKAARRFQRSQEDETEETRVDRLERARVRDAERREQENEEEQAERLERARLKDAEKRKRENEEQRVGRLERSRVRVAERREQENEEEQAERLERARVRDAERREQENEDERTEKLLITRQRNRARRMIPVFSMCWNRAAFAYEASINYSSFPEMSIGEMNNVCQYCLAKKWKGEAPGMCCTGGKIKLLPLTQPPDILCKLLADDNTASVHFRNNVWNYNSAFMMTSFGADKDLTDRGFFTTFKIQDQCYHRIVGLLPDADNEPKYAQVYFMGGGREEAQQGCRLNSSVDMDTIVDLQDMLHNTHPNVQSFKYALELEQMNIPDRKLVIHADRRPAGEHSGVLMHQL